jgi:zinc protease
VVLSDSRVRQPALTRNYLVPSYPTAKPGEAEALDVLAHVLGSGSLSRLYRALVVDQAIAVSAGAWYSGMALDSSRFGLYASPKPDTSLEALEAAVNAVIAEVSAHGISESELERAKTRLIADSMYAQDSQSTLARMYGAGLVVGMKVEEIRSWPDRIRAVTGDSVRNAARTWLDLRRAVTGHLVRPASVTEKPS